MASTDSGISSNPQTNILDEEYPSPDYPDDDITDSSQGSNGYSGVERTVNNCRPQKSTQIPNSYQDSSGFSDVAGANDNRRPQERQVSTLSQVTSGYIGFDRANNNKGLEESKQGISGPIYDNNLGDHNKCAPISPYRQIPAIYTDFSNPTGNGHLMNNIRLGISNFQQPRHSHANDVENFIPYNKDNLNRKGIRDKINRVIKIFITTVTIAGLALMLTFLANDQGKIEDLNAKIQTQTSSLKGNNNSLGILLENQREEVEKTSEVINITEMNLLTNSNLTANILSLSYKTKRSFKEIGEMIEAMSNRTNTSINKVGNMMEASFSQLQSSSEDIANTMEVLSNHTKTSNSDVKEVIKEQSNQTKTYLEDMMKDLLKDLKDELVAVIESRIGGGCVNNSLNVTTGACVDSCLRVEDGDYQSCDTCHGYVTCSHNYIFPRNCSETNHNLIWDDSIKRCETQSKTCNPSDFT